MLINETLCICKDNWLDVRTIPALLIPFEATELAANFCMRGAISD
jgi:hypothetical protein